jgi:hypothetical protein
VWIIDEEDAWTVHTSAGMQQRTAFPVTLDLPPRLAH